MNKTSKRSKVKVGSEVVVNGVWYVVTEVPTFGAYAWVADQNGGEKEFLISGLVGCITK